MRAWIPDTGLVILGALSVAGAMREAHAGPPGIEVITMRPEAALQPGDGQYVLELSDALMDGRALELILGGVGGQFGQAWGIVPPHRDVAQWADASGLSIAHGRLAGTVKARVDQVIHEYRVDLPVPLDSDEEVALEPGRFDCRQGITDHASSTGTLAGALLPLADHQGTVSVELHLGKAIQGPNDWHRRVLLTLTFAGGKATNVTARPDTNRSVSWKAERRALAVALDEDGLKGRATLDFRMGGKTNCYTFALEAEVSAGVASGNVVTTLDGEEILRTRCFGTAAPVSPAAATRDDAIYRLTLARAVADAHDLELYFELRNGAAAAVARVPRAGAYTHRLDALGLKIKEDGVSGELKATIRPAGWPTWDDKPTLCGLTVEAAFSEGDVLAGVYEKEELIETRSGSLTAKRRPWQRVRRENALAKGMDYPQWRGPFYNGSGPSSGHTLVDDLTQSRIAWRSEAATPDSWIWSKTLSPLFGAGFSSPVIRDERLYVAYYMPSGTAVDTAQVARLDVPVKWLIDADNVVLCVDAVTGATLWKTTFPGRGLNYNLRLSGPHMTPCATEDAVYLVGSLGDVYGLDAVTGGLRWQTDLGTEAEDYRKLKEDCFRTQSLVERSAGCSAAARWSPTA